METTRNTIDSNIYTCEMRERETSWWKIAIQGNYKAFKYGMVQELRREARIEEKAEWHIDKESFQKWSRDLNTLARGVMFRRKDDEDVENAKITNEKIRLDDIEVRA